VSGVSATCQPGRLFSPTTIAWGFVALTSILVGTLVVTNPSIAMLVLGGTIAVAVLNVAPLGWVISGVLMAAFSRLLIAAGVVPPVTFFLHFPLVLGGALLVTLRRRGATVKGLGPGIVAMLVWTLLSGIANGGELFKSLLFWIVWCEPFLLLYVMLTTPMNARTRTSLSMIFLGIVFAQIPVSIWQAVHFGLGDPVTGTFGRPKLVGAVALLGAMALTARVLFEQSWSSSLPRIAGIAVLLPVPVIASAKSVLGVSLVSMFYLLASTSLRNLKRWVPVALVAAVVIGLGSHYYSIGATFTSLVAPKSSMNHPVSEFVRRKAYPLVIFADYARSSPEAWLIGFGPGTTFSKIAWLTSGSSLLAKSDSPVTLLGTSVSSITQDALTINFAGPRGKERSSAWEIWSGWTGILGDLGLLGLAIYGSLWWILWRQSRLDASWRGACARALILNAVLLGGWNTWFEDAEYTLVVALILGLMLGARMLAPAGDADPDKGRIAPFVV
jgi:hypothetical protein